MGGGGTWKNVGRVLTDVSTLGGSELYGYAKDKLVDNPKQKAKDAATNTQAEFDAEVARQSEEKRRIGPAAKIGDPAKNYDAARRRRFLAMQKGIGSTIRTSAMGAGGTPALATSSLNEGLKTKLGQ